MPATKGAVVIDAVLAIGTRPGGLLVAGSERSAELLDRLSGPTGDIIDLSNRNTGRIRATKEPVPQGDPKIQCVISARDEPK